MRGRSIDFYPFFSNHKTLSTQRPAIKNHFSSAVHTIASQLSIFPRGHESMAKKKKVANKATHQQAEMWEPGVFGPGPLCHADNLLPIFCQFFFFCFFFSCGANYSAGLPSIMQQLKNYYVYNNFGFSSFFRTSNWVG